MSQLADSFMAIFGFQRVATVQGNVITPTVWDDMVMGGSVDAQKRRVAGLIPAPPATNYCPTCGEDHEGNVPRGCETGDGA